MCIHRRLNLRLHRIRGAAATKLADETAQKTRIEKERAETARTLDLKPFGKFLGTYSHPAYGTINICPAASPPGQYRSYGKLSYSDYRQQCRWSNELNARLPEALGGAELAASYESAIVQSLQFHWLSGNVFNVSMYYVPELGVPMRGGPSVVMPILPQPKNWVEFVVSEDGKSSVGFAWSEVWGKEEDIEDEVSGDSVKERAQVWFDKVGHPWA